MKRIISLVMSVLMIATMFCGFAVTSTAADNVAEITVVAGDVQDDGTFSVSWYVNDLSTYGFHRFDFDMSWNEAECEPVMETIIDGDTLAETSAWADIEPVYTYIIDVAKQKFNSKVIFEGDSWFPEGYYLNPDMDYPRISVEASTTRPFGWSSTWLTKFKVDADAYKYSAEYGFCMATATFRMKDGVEKATLTAIPMIANIGLTTNTSAYETAVDRVAVTPVTVERDLTPAVPTLPAGITLAVEDGASIRTADPAGMRFYANVKAADFSEIQEMGVVISKGTDTLKIPARVDVDGNYLQDYDTDAAGKKTFKNGVTAKDGTTVRFTAVLSNIKQANLSADFTATAYVVVDGETYYSTTTCTRNYNYVAEKAANDATTA